MLNYHSAWYVSLTRKSGVNRKEKTVIVQITWSLIDVFLLDERTKSATQFHSKVFSDTFNLENKYAQEKQIIG